MLALVWTILSINPQFATVRVTPEPAQQEAGTARDVRVRLQPGMTDRAIQQRIITRIGRDKAQMKRAFVEAARVAAGGKVKVNKQPAKRQSRRVERPVSKLTGTTGSL